MIPRTSGGRGFKGAAAYYLHDKGARSADRVRFTHTLNLSTDNPERAIAEMIYTAEHAGALKAAAGVKATGRKLEKPVYTLALSWHPSEQPTEAQMIAAGRAALAALKMDHHQVLMVAHNDTAHAHIHLIVNRIDADNGKAHGLKKDQLILSQWAEAYERAFGQTWCTDRVQNNAARQADARTGRGPFVKDRKSQAREQRGAYDRRHQASTRNQAAAARQKAEAAQKQARFADWQTSLQNALQDRHNDERHRLSVRFEQRRTRTEERVEQAYGESRRDQEKRLAALDARDTHGSVLSRFVDRLKRIDEDRSALQKNLASIAQRSDEMRSPIARQEEQESAALARQHEAERAHQAKLIDTQARAGHEIPQQRTAAQRSPDRGRDRGRGRDFS